VPARAALGGDGGEREFVVAKVSARIGWPPAVLAARRRAALLLALLTLAACDGRSMPEPQPAQATSLLDDRLRTVTGEALQLDRIVRVGGFAYSARISGAVPGLRDGGDGRTVRVVEDGRALGPAGALSAEVVTLGGGRFNHETATRVLFSASDNSDPRRNGRTYRVEWDEPARVVARRETRTIGLGASTLQFDTAADRPLAPRRLVIENGDDRRSVQVWGRAAGAPDLTTRDAILASVVRPGMSDEDKALALWAAMVRWRHHDVAAAAGLEASDPVKLLGVYGFGFCNDVAHALASLLQRAGLRARVVAWDQHSVVEVQLDGRWRMLDPDLGRIYRTGSGQLASVADVFARRAVAVYSPAGELPIEDERFDVAYPRGANRNYLRPLGTSAHALRPVLAPGDSVVFDFARGDRFVDRFSHERPAGWPIRFANGTLRRKLVEAGPDGCRVTRIAWPYPIVGVRLTARHLTTDGPLVAQIRGQDGEEWQDLRVERVAADASADAAVWLAGSPIRYGLEARICGAGLSGWRSASEVRLKVAFQFAPRTVPSVAPGAGASQWTVQDVDASRSGRFGGVRVTQEWDELDAPSELAVPAGGAIENLERSFFAPARGATYATQMTDQLPPGAAFDPQAGATLIALLENGRRLGPEVASVADAVSSGRGSFALDGARLVFSASDDTDPRVNGRLYSVVLAPGAAPPSPGG
jgi:transglutaminase-like putative cysteine protease